MCKPSSPKEKTQRNVRPFERLSIERSVFVDILCFLAPALFHSFTDTLPIFITGILRIASTHIFLTTHYLFFDKDNYNMKLSARQLERERRDYLVGIILHMWVQVALQLLFPTMFFSEWSGIGKCALNTLIYHVTIVEPLYYAVHRWLHVPEQFKKMHGFHHSSVNTVPSTSLVQNFQEHFVYVATFGPAMLLPYFLNGANHWTVTAGYLLLFDIVNAFGHTNIVIRHWLFDSKWSPLRYLFYTPEFHLGHHAYYNYNFGLFMPLWDHLFHTYREYRRPDAPLEPADKQDFVFIGHNGGLGHFLTIPEVSVYNAYDSYVRTLLPIELEMMIAHAIVKFSSLIYNTYKLSRYLVDGNYVGRVICVLRTPLDYNSAETHATINLEILQLIRDEHRRCGTRYFGLGNLNKMKSLNDGGVAIARMINEDAALKEKNIRIWTGDTLTTASVYYQVVALPKLKRIFFIGANGKIGTAVCRLLLERGGVEITIFSSYQAIVHPNVKYTQNLTDMATFKYVLIGKAMHPNKYRSALKAAAPLEGGMQYLMDYTVPYFPLVDGSDSRTTHLQIGVLKVTATKFLRGHFDVCFGIEQNHIYPCHAGCLLNMQMKRESDEVGEIDLGQVDSLWQRAVSNGLENKVLSIE